jgi:hypothetical protein
VPSAHRIQGVGVRRFHHRTHYVMDSALMMGSALVGQYFYGQCSDDGQYSGGAVLLWTVL